MNKVLKCSEHVCARLGDVLLPKSARKKHAAQDSDEASTGEDTEEDEESKWEDEESEREDDEDKDMEGDDTDSSEEAIDSGSEGEDLDKGKETGGADNTAKELEKGKTSKERAELYKHAAEVLKEVGLVVVDEAHKVKNPLGLLVRALNQVSSQCTDDCPDHAQPGNRHITCAVAVHP
jgi:hypothetical protein